MLTRGGDRRSAEISDLFTFEFKGEGPTRCMPLVLCFRTCVDLSRAYLQISSQHSQVPGTLQSILYEGSGTLKWSGIAKINCYIILSLISGWLTNTRSLTNRIKYISLTCTSYRV